MYTNEYCGVSQGILYLLSPVSFTLLTRYPQLQKYCASVGLLLSVSGSLLSSFSITVWHLIVTQGVLCAVGNGLVFSPTTLYLDQWFVRRKGLAYGIMWAAKSICGVVLPFLASACLERFGARTTLRAWTVTTVSTIFTHNLFNGKTIAETRISSQCLYPQYGCAPKSSSLRGFPSAGLFPPMIIPYWR